MSDAGDEDLFADLYADDPPAKPAQAVPAAKPEVSEPVNPEPTHAQAEEPAFNGADGGDGADHGAYTGGGDVDMQGSGYDGNAHQQYDNAQGEDDDNYGPINVKEDG